MNTNWRSISPLSHRSDSQTFERAQPPSAGQRPQEIAENEKNRADSTTQAPIPVHRQTDLSIDDKSDTETDMDMTSTVNRSRPLINEQYPEDIWQMTLHELALQMPAATYETWVRDTSIIAYEDGEFIIGVPHDYARGWLENRLRNNIKRILSKLIQRSVQVTFQVRPRPEKEPATPEPLPLYIPQATVEETQTLIPKNSSAVPDDNATTARPEPALGSNEAAAPTPMSEQTIADTSTTDFDTAIENDDYISVPQLDTAIYGHALNPRYTFETFVVGNHNRLAQAAALSIVEQPGHHFNPLFVYGGVGLGKTHLLHAIGHEMARHGMRILYCSSEQFTNELISAIRQQSTEEFRNKYRQIDLLLIDDIQFIGGKESTQEEFFHTFNYLHASGHQIVISSDRPPKEIATLEARLCSRFEGGLQADISQPDLETRVAILQSKVPSSNLPNDVLMLVAERVESNIRELEGALNRLIVQAPLYQSHLDRSVAEEILDNLVPQRRPREASSVVEIVANHFNLIGDDLRGRTRIKDVVNARQFAMYLLREENGLSLPHIGELLGGRDHSTVRYGVDKMAKDLERDEGIQRDLVALREKIYTPSDSSR